MYSLVELDEFGACGASVTSTVSPGWAFSQADFADLGARSTIDSALHRQERKSVIRRVIRGIYDYPRHSKALGGPTSPNIDQIAHALARKFAWRIQPDGATAQNLLGLSTQVPARVVYLSDGPDRSYTVGRTNLAFEHKAGFLAGGLPIGERKKLEVARVLATGPDLLLLDEVMGGLNPAESEEIIQLILELKRHGLTPFSVKLMT